MAQKYVSVPHGDMGSGIDQLSSEDSIPEGYSELLVNWDCAPEGYLSKRAGYQGVYGHLPVRVAKLMYTTAGSANLTFVLDSAIDLTRIPSPKHSRPLVAFGRASAAASVAGGSGDFTQGVDRVRYYSGFTADPRLTVAHGANTLTLAASATGLAVADAFVDVLQSTSPTDSSWSLVRPDSVAVNTSTFEVDLGLTNGGPAYAVYTPILPRPALSGTTYVSGTLTFATGTHSQTITAGTHGLSDANLLARCFVLAGGLLTEVRAASITLDTSANVVVTITNSTGSSLGVVVILTAAPTANAVQGSVGAGTSATFTFAPASSAFATVAAWVEQTIGGTRELVEPDSVTYDASTGLIGVTLTNAGAAAASFDLFWLPTSVAINQLTVDASTVGTAFTDTHPQLTLWGLDHSSLYGGTAGPRAGWVTELDTYRATGEAFLVAGLGGCLFQGQQADAATASRYLIPQALYPNLRGRTGMSTRVGPALVNTLDASARTAGTIQADNVGTFASASSVTWASPTPGVMQVVVPLTNPLVTGSPIITTAGFADQLTVQGAGWALQNGTFDILTWAVASGALTLTVSNPALTSTDWDDTQSSAGVAILTDRLTLGAASPFVPGDLLLAPVLTQDQLPMVVASSGTQVLLGGLVQELAFPAGVRVTGERQSRVLPLRDAAANPSVTNVVGGDNLVLTGLARQLRVLNVNVLADTAVTLAGTGAVATATLGSGVTDTLAVGDLLLLAQAGPYSGTVVVASVPTPTTFTFASTQTASTSGTLVGATVGLDEPGLGLTWQDAADSSVQVQVPGRWLPLEAPDTAATETPGPYSSYLTESSYTDQPIMRSCMVNDTLILNNGVDRTLKLDGASVYRPGLPRWQPQLFASVASAASGTIDVPLVSCATTAWANNRFTVAAADSQTFLVGAQIQRLGDTTVTYTVEGTDTTTGYVYVNRNVAGATGADTLVQVSKRSYYFRLNAVDANRNVIASAAAGSVDWTVTLATSAAVRLRLVGLPAWDIYDYDRLEVEVYGTKLNGVAPFYRLTTLPMSFGPGGGYIDYTDTAADETLSDLDVVNTALKGQELGTGWSHPIRAKRVTSASNRLVMANLTSDPLIDVTLNNKGGVVTTGVLSGLRWLLRRDETDAGTATDMTNRVGLQWLTSTDLSVTAVSVGTGTFTVTTTLGAAVAAGNWVYLFRKAAPSTNQQLHFAGWWQVASRTATTITVNWPGATGLTPVLADEVDRAVAAMAPADVPVWLGVDYNYVTKVATLGQDGVDPAESMAALRLCNALNTTQRVVDRSLTGYAGFTPWVCCDAGGEFAVGQFVLRQVQAASVVPSLTLPTGYTAMNVFVNQVLRAAASTVGAISLLFPSRLLISYPNFAEIVDSPLVQVDSQSDSAIDVNPSDGQEITAVIPFFGDSTFGAAMKDAIVLVFKTNSVYVVNIAAKAAGQNPVQRLETMGLGCTAPNSVTPTRTGILFANESGIYKLQQDQTLYYMGRHIQRLWREGVNLSASSLELCFGHNYAFGSTYKLSVPMVGSSVPSNMFVYNSTREYSMQGITNTIQLYATKEGGWTQHQLALPSIGFASLADDSFEASMKGRVLALRRTGLPQDFRDDASAISATATLRALDYGDTGVRKTVPYVVVSYRNPTQLGARQGLQVATAVDMAQEFTPAALTLLPNNGQTQGTGDFVQQQVQTYRYSVRQKRGLRFQLQFTDSTIDEPVEITKIAYIVAGLAPAKGIREASQGPAPAQGEPS